MSGVYTLTNTRTGRVYVGAALVDVDARLAHQCGALWLGRHANKDLQADWIALGGDAFRAEVVQRARLEDDPAVLEAAWIKRYQDSGVALYNRYRLSGLRSASTVTKRRVEIDCEACGEPTMAIVRLTTDGPVFYRRTCGWPYPSCSVRRRPPAVPAAGEGRE